MKLFKTLPMHWWELGLIKSSAVFFGIVVGAFWPNVFAPYLLPLLAASAITGFVFLHLWLKK